MAIRALARSSVVARSGVARASQRAPLRLRAEPEKKAGVIQYGGVEYTAEQWEAAKATGNLPTAEPLAAAAAPAAPAAPAAVSFGNLMAFSGPAPEIINGRLAMLGVVAALAAEFSSGESVLKQLGEEPTGIVLVFGLIIAASFAPLLSNVLPSAKSLGPFNSKAEMLNGRAAMIGIAALLAIEFVKGSALF
ncbi:hypothetical protein Rsub_05016 [Raphidocelis subcapitata]|uniref:Uncharacterized protein n=1 Tax=Raphidocelis subcapitata TaxID=307507 RepID=A0A2V0P640_9CHLO|nr:hypothetical protein Rsub_05016 [Raphidocelis subcapitata]|eukprot:GBF92647.1 hypothetical protein Rsub_05016 [Raphidocelis subcapitata]